MILDPLCVQHLEKLIIPNCKKIPNEKLCEVLRRNPSLLHVDISNKTDPKIDSDVLTSLAHSCRHLQVLKLSDYRIEDPTHLLVLCGRSLARSGADSPESQQSHAASVLGNETSAREQGEQVVPQLFESPSPPGQPSSSSTVPAADREDPPRSKLRPLNCNSLQAGLSGGTQPHHCLTHRNQFGAPGASNRPAIANTAAEAEAAAGDQSRWSSSLEAMTGRLSLTELVINSSLFMLSIRWWAHTVHVRRTCGEKCC